MKSARNKFPFAILPCAASARVAAGLLLATLAACSGDQASDIPPQKWRDVEVRVESRPSPPRAGMDEFLIMVNKGQGRPAYNLIVSLRTSDQDQWKQAIEDGQMGVYRRAVKVEPDSALQVRIKREGEEAEGILYFPLKLKP